MRLSDIPFSKVIDWYRQNVNAYTVTSGLGLLPTAFRRYFAFNEDWTSSLLNAQCYSWTTGHESRYEDYSAFADQLRRHWDEPFFTPFLVYYIFGLGKTNLNKGTWFGDSTPNFYTLSSSPVPEEFPCIRYLLWIPTILNRELWDIAGLSLSPWLYVYTIGYIGEEINLLGRYVGADYIYDLDSDPDEPENDYLPSLNELSLENKQAWGNYLPDDLVANDGDDITSRNMRHNIILREFCRSTACPQVWKVSNGYPELDANRYTPETMPGRLKRAALQLWQMLLWCKLNYERKHVYGRSINKGTIELAANESESIPLLTRFYWTGELGEFARVTNNQYFTTFVMRMTDSQADLRTTCDGITIPPLLGNGSLIVDMQWLPLLVDSDGSSLRHSMAHSNTRYIPCYLWSRGWIPGYMLRYMHNLRRPRVGALDVMKHALISCDDPYLGSSLGSNAALPAIHAIDADSGLDGIPGTLNNYRTVSPLLPSRYLDHDDMTVKEREVLEITSQVAHNRLYYQDPIVGNNLAITWQGYAGDGMTALMFRTRYSSPFGQIYSWYHDSDYRSYDIYNPAGEHGDENAWKYHIVRTHIGASSGFPSTIDSVFAI